MPLSAAVCRSPLIGLLSVPGYRVAEISEYRDRPYPGSGRTSRVRPTRYSARAVPALRIVRPHAPKDVKNLTREKSLLSFVYLSALRSLYTLQFTRCSHIPRHIPFFFYLVHVCWRWTPQHNALTSRSHTTPCSRTCVRQLSRAAGLALCVAERASRQAHRRSSRSSSRLTCHTEIEAETSRIEYPLTYPLTHLPGRDQPHRVDECHGRLHDARSWCRTSSGGVPSRSGRRRTRITHADCWAGQPFTRLCARKVQHCE